MNLFNKNISAFLSCLIVLFFVSGNAFSETKKSYYDSGKLKAEYEWSDGQMNGQCITYYENGSMKTSGNYKNGKQIGVWVNYNENGDTVAHYDYGAAVAQSENTSQKHDENSRNEEKAAPVSSHVFVLSADPLGFLLMGPMVHAEIPIAGVAGITAGLRFPSIGLITNMLYNNMKMAWMTDFSIRLYMSRRMYSRGFYIGPGFEIGRSYYNSTFTNIDQYGTYLGESPYTSSYLLMAFGGEIGYKWVWPSKFCLDIGDYIGPVFNKRDDEHYQSQQWNFDMFVFYLLSVKLGYAFEEWHGGAYTRGYDFLALEMDRTKVACDKLAGILRERKKKPCEIHFPRPQLAECAFKKAISLFDKSILIV